jgi:hypothetical protein
MGQFDDPFKVSSLVYNLKLSEQPRSINRARINALFNGNPPYSEQEARENRVGVNCNFLEAPRIAQDARRTYYNAFIRPGNYFTVTLDAGPPEKRLEWGHIITRNINRVMKDSLPYINLLQCSFAQMVLHGTAPVFWPKRQKWMPEFLGIDEILLPSRTRQSMDNLSYFAIHRRYTIGELYDMTSGEAVDKGWNMPLVKKLMERLAKQVGAPGYIPQPQFYEYERFEEDLKANSGWWASDAAPSITVWDFYYCDEYDTNEGGYGWKRKMILDSDCETTTQYAPEFIFDPKDRVYASELSHLLHINYADGCTVPPFLYHSTRSLGFMLYAVCHLQNRLRCKHADATFESTVQLFRNHASDSAERLERIDLQNFGVLPDGVEFVPAADRFRMDFELVNSAFAMNRQLMSENSSAFTRDINDGTQKELTATETMARVNEASAMVGSMLNMAYTYQKYQYQEIARRFCLQAQSPNPDRDILKFQKRCLMEGLPPQAFNSEAWIVEVERVVGTGNKTLELAQTSELVGMAERGLLDPDAARLATHIRVEALVDDPALADRLVPMGQQQTSEAMEIASLAWASLIDSKPVVVARGMNEIDYVETLLHDLNIEIDHIEKAQEVPAPKRIAGLANVIQHIMQHVALIAQNDAMGPKVKQYGDQLKAASNYVRKYAQQAQEKAQASGGPQMDPELMGRLKAMLIEADAKAQISKDLAAGKEARKDASFVRDQARRDAKTRSELSTEDLKTSAGIIRDNAEAHHGVHVANVTAVADSQREDVLAAADVARQNAAVTQVVPQTGE